VTSFQMTTHCVDSSLGTDRRGVIVYVYTSNPMKLQARENGDFGKYYN
jgi:hypothetical protein